MKDPNNWRDQLNDPIQIFNLQMRTPLSQAFSAINRIAAERSDDKELLAQLQPVNTACYRMLRTVINFSADELLEKSMFPYQPQPGDLCGFFRQLCTDSAEHLALSGIRTEFSVPQQTCICLFDEKILSRVLMNLLSNACRFLSADGTISVKLAVTDGQAVLTVSDDGCGIAQDVLPRVFDRFYSCDPATGIPCGDGLGLSICQRLMALHGGSIVLRSEPGKGTDAAVMIPLVPAEGNAVLQSKTKSLSEDRFSDLYVILSDSIEPEIN